MVMPASLFQAAIALGLLWHWPRFVGALLLGFHGLLRPAEFLPLCRRDLVLPRDSMSDDEICYIKILHSKTSRFMLRQHARITDRLSVAYLDATFGRLPQEHSLFNCSQSAFRSRWNKLFSTLGVPTTEKARGVTPKSLGDLVLRGYTTTPRTSAESSGVVAGSRVAPWSTTCKM